MNNEIVLCSESKNLEKMKHRFSFFGPACALYALFYTFCLYKNSSGITYPFFITGSLLFFCLCIKKLEISLKKNSCFMIVSLILLGISTCLTDDYKIIFMNKTGIFVLLMCFFLHQFFQDAGWTFGKYLAEIFRSCFGAVGMLGYPFYHADFYRKEKEGRGKGLYIILGISIAVPLLFVVLLLLMSSDVIFRQLLEKFFKAISISDILGVFLLVCFAFFASYCLLSWFCQSKIKETTKDKRTGEPLLAITIGSVLTVIYLLFCGIQVFSLFLKQMALPEGYTYAGYAREGFFQLLAVCVINLILVLFGLHRFRESKGLKIVLTVMSACTYILIASSAMRMVMYIRYYYLTFLRIFVLWSLAVLAVLLTGMILTIYRKDFPLFRYCMMVVTSFYVILAFSHPDYFIAKCNLAQLECNRQKDSFFLGEQYADWGYLGTLSADAAPAIAKAFPEYVGKSHTDSDVNSPEESFYDSYMKKIYYKQESVGLRSFNFSRWYADRVL